MPEETDKTTPAPAKVEDLPDWAQKVISDARAEAANYRTRLRDAKDEAKGEVQAEFQKQLDERDKLLSDKESALANTKLEADRIRVALKAGVPGDRAEAFGSRLRGSNIEELEADAQSALEVFGAPVVGSSRATDRTQGQGKPPPKSTDDIFGDFITSQLGKH